MAEGLRGERVVLREQRRSDLAVLHGFRQDPELWLLISNRPWLPTSLAAAEKQFEKELAEDPPADRAFFVVERLDDSSVLGYALLWGIDAFHRSAHIGIALLPEVRGGGVGRDVLRLLCDYGFRIRGLRRLQIETLTSNAAALGAAAAAGFVREGVLREAEWGAPGAFTDVVLLGLLDREWSAS